MKILNFKTINGPSVYHRKPVLIMKVDLELWTDQSSQEIHGFNEKLMETFPGLMEHTCSPGHYGGFYERLLRGTYLAHIIEHVAIELSSLTDIPVRYGKTVYAGRKGHYNIVTRFASENGMTAALNAAFSIVEAIILKRNFNLAEHLENIVFETNHYKLGPSGEALMKAAESKKIPCLRIGNESLLRLGYGRKIRYVQAAVTDRTSNIAVELVQDKDLTKLLLKKFEIPVPEGSVITSADEIAEAVKKLTAPLALKPLDGHHGQGVCLNLNSHDELQRAFATANKYSAKVMIEEMCQGKDYRVLVVDSKMVAAAERIPPFVVGDGAASIESLINILNLDSRRSAGHGGTLTRIEVDDVLTHSLAMKELHLQSVLEKERKVFLRDNANLSSGGTAKDVTDDVHPEVRILCERISRLVGLDICGIDLIHSDISAACGNSLKVIEVNAGPGLRMHLDPNEGKSRDVGSDIINMLYPTSESARIPILSVTGTNGKTSTVRMLKKIFSADPQVTVGMTSSDGIWIGEDKIADGDTSGPGSALVVLSDPKVDVAILELARGGLLRGGLSYDESDIAIVTNICEDHIGQDGIEDIVDLVRIKSLIVEHVRENGTVILNADDPQSVGLMKRDSLFKVPKNIILYSMNPFNRELSKHLSQNKDACWLQDGKIKVMYGGQFFSIGPAKNLPVTMGGAVHFQISNVLATVAAAIASGISPELIYKSLMGFDPNLENAGRVNLYKVHEGFVFLDYAHNPDSISAMGKMIANFKGYRKTAILGLPGDRDSKLLEQSGHALAPYFDHVVFRDDFDLRGRAPREVPELLQRLFQKLYPNISTEIIANENESIEKVLGRLTEKNIIVLFYDSLIPVMKSLRQFDPVAIATIPILAFESENEETAFNPELVNMPSSDNLTME